jgi:hypothetical protein
MIPNERILEIATEKMLDRKANILPTFTCMTNDDEIIAFSRAIAKEQMECDARVCELARIEDGDGQHTQWYAGVDECIAAIRNQKVEG